MGAVAHDHVFREPGNVINGLLPVLRGVGLGDHLGGDHGEHIRQRHDAPAVQQPDQKVHIVMGLNAPDNGPVAVLVGGELLFLIGLLCQSGDLPVRLLKHGQAAADGHVVGLGIERQVGAKDLGIRSLVHLQPLHAALGSVVDTLGAFKIVGPIPLLAGLFLNEGDGVADLLSGVLLHIVLPVAQGRCQLEHRNTILQLQPLGDDAVAHQGAVAGGVALDSAGAQNGSVVIDGHAGFRLRHGADIAGKTVFLGHIDIVAGSPLVQKDGNIGGGNLPAEGNQGGEAHHDGLHLVLIHQDNLLGKLRIVADAAVPPEELVQQLCHILNDQILLHVADAQMLAPQALGVPIHHHGHGQIVGHPAVAEKGLDVPGLHQHHPEHGHPVVQPAGIVIGGVHNAAPFPAFPNSSAGIQAAEVLRSDPFVRHYLAPP